MFSEALEIMDRNTVKYMMEDRDEKIRQLTGELEEQASKNKQLAEKIDEQMRLNDELMKRLDALEANKK